MKGDGRRGTTCPRDCGALCCKYIVRKIPAPRSKYDVDEIYWFLCHEKVAVYVERRRWYLLVEVACQHLDRRFRCRIYPVRPYVCRLHARELCEHTGKIEFQEFLYTPEDLVRYLRKRGRPFRLPWSTVADPGRNPQPAARGSRSAAGDARRSRGQPARPAKKNEVCHSGANP